MCKQLEDEIASMENSEKADIERDDDAAQKGSTKEEAKFVKRLGRGTGKYKDKIPFKCFNCGKVGHYASKCPNKITENHSKGKEKRSSYNMQNGKKFEIKTFFPSKIVVHLKSQMNPQMKMESQNSH